MPFLTSTTNDFAQWDHCQSDRYHCTFSKPDSANDISHSISRDLNHLEALAEKVFDYCLMTKSAFIRLVLSSVCLDVGMEGGYLDTQYSFGTQLA